MTSGFLPSLFFNHTSLVCMYSSSAEVVWCPPSCRQSGTTAGLGRGWDLGLHQAGLHSQAVPRSHLPTPPGCRHRALRQQDAGSVHCLLSRRLWSSVLWVLQTCSFSNLVLNVFFIPVSQGRGNLASHSCESQLSLCHAIVCGWALETESSSPSL